MQEQALEPDLLAQALVDVRIAILVVARDRMADVLRMHADLVGAAGLDAHLAVRMPAAPLQRTEMAQRRLAAIVDLHVALAALAQAHVQRRVDAHHSDGPATGTQREGALATARAGLPHQR